MRTFSRDAWNEAQDLWLDFSAEWKPWRHKAAMRGMLYPPEGTRWDSWDDDEPSQRAMLIRAMRETPKLLDVAISRSRSWGAVIAYVIARRDEMRSDLDERDRAMTRRRADEPDGRQSTSALKAILNRIGDS